MKNSKLLIKKQVVFKPAKLYAGSKSDKHPSTVTVLPTTDIIRI